MWSILVIQITHLCSAGNGEPGEEPEVQPPLRRGSHTGPDQEEAESEEEVPVRRSPSASCRGVESGFAGVNK